MRFFHSMGLVALFFSACTAPPEANTFAELYIRYDDETKALKAEALFFELADEKIGASKVFPGGVQFINSGMKTVELPGNKVRYAAHLDTGLPKSLSFTWPGPKNEPQATQVKLSRIGKISIGENDTLSISKGLRLIVEGQNLDASEKLILSFMDKKRQGKTLETKGPTSTMTFNIPGKEITGLALGPAELTIVRSRTEKITGQGRAGTITTDFYAAPILFEIIE